MFSVTMQFPSVVSMLEFFARAAGVVAPQDRPDAGAPVVTQATPAADIVPPAALVFTPVVHPLAVQPTGAVAPPLPPAAPFTAAAAVLPTAPAAPGLVPSVPPAAAPSAPTPAASAPAPTVAAAPPSPAAAAGSDLDADGLPWDGRIHAGTKGRNADGRWKARKNLNDPAMVDRVRAELRQAVALRGVATAPVAPVPVPPAAPVAPVPVPPAAPVAPVPVPPAAPRDINVGELMLKIQAPMVSGQLSQDALNATLMQHGLANLAMLIHAPHLAPAVDATLSTSLGLAPGPVAA